MIASSEVASAWSCVSPSQVSVGTKRMPPPTPKMPGEDTGDEAEQDRERVGHWRSIRIAIATRRPAKRNESVRTGSALLEDAAACGAEGGGHADEECVCGLDLAVDDVRDDAGGCGDADRRERRRRRGTEIPVRDEQEQRHDHDAAADAEECAEEAGDETDQDQAHAPYATRVAVATDALLDRLTAAPGEAGHLPRLRRRARADRRAARGRVPARRDAGGARAARRPLRARRRRQRAGRRRRARARRRRRRRDRRLARPRARPPGRSVAAADRRLRAARRRGRRRRSS